jgi:tetratricopeptide (TPR) repeat protein
MPVVPRSAPDPEIERRRNEIMQAYLSYRRQDAFDLLGVPEDANPEAFERRFLEFSRRFAPWTLDHSGLEGMEERARDLFLAGARAFAELMDAEQRNTLLFRRKTLREERARKPTASFAIKTDLLDAEAQYKKGKALADAGKHREALMLLEFAADCDPQNGLYAAELAYCRFLLTSANANRALKELNETLRRDPNCGLAAYYAGEIERQTGDAEAAEAHLRRAIKLMSPDRRPIDALKALSTERRR